MSCRAEAGIEKRDSADRVPACAAGPAGHARHVIASVLAVITRKPRARRCGTSEVGRTVEVLHRHGCHGPRHPSRPIPPCCGMPHEPRKSRQPRSNRRSCAHSRCSMRQVSEGLRATAWRPRRPSPCSLRAASPSPCARRAAAGPQGHARRPAPEARGCPSRSPAALRSVAAVVDWPSALRATRTGAPAGSAVSTCRAAATESPSRRALARAASRRAP